MDTNIGRFVWHELLTPNVPAAIAFYTEVVGWKTQTWGESGEPYTMWVGGQGPLGGVYTLPEEAKKMGAPPHWMGHVEVANVDETATRVKALGGRVYLEPHDIPKIGRIAVIADPQGAAISVFKPTQSMAPHDTKKPDEIVWNELITTDHKAAFRFYSEIFGWVKTGEFDMGGMGEYLMYGQKDKTYGGMFTKPAGQEAPTAWVYYVHVADLDAAIARAKAKGATVLVEAMEVPGGERIAQLLDPQGAAFALHGDALPKAS